MPEIIKVYSQIMPKTRFIGKRYLPEDRINGSYSSKWDEWFEHGWFSCIENMYKGNLTDFFADSDAYIGLICVKPEERSEYWIGMFLPEGTEVPEGFSYVDFPESKLAVVWVKGNIPAIYSMVEACINQINMEGFTFEPNEKGEFWYFERYNCPRFTSPNENGEVILDICLFVK